MPELATCLRDAKELVWRLLENYRASGFAVFYAFLAGASLGSNQGAITTTTILAAKEKVADRSATSTALQICGGEPWGASDGK